jgi:hypothetical protein
VRVVFIYLSACTELVLGTSGWRNLEQDLEDAPIGQMTNGTQPPAECRIQPGMRLSMGRADKTDYYHFYLCFSLCLESLGELFFVLRLHCVGNYYILGWSCWVHAQSTGIRGAECVVTTGWP